MPTFQQERTHDEVKKPQIDLRHLADYMAAQGRERARRAILQKCRYRKRAQTYNHQEAKRAIREYFSEGAGEDMSSLAERAQFLRDKLTDGSFERNLADYNADFIEAFMESYEVGFMKKAELLPPKKVPEVYISGVLIKVETFAAFRRFMRGSNRERMGALMLRYAKGETLPASVGDWQSAILFGYLKKYGNTHPATPEEKLCVTLCAVSGQAHEAPSKSTDMFNEAEAACATISEAWPNIKPPDGAIL